MRPCSGLSPAGLDRMGGSYGVTLPVGPLIESFPRYSHPVFDVFATRVACWFLIDVPVGTVALVAAIIVLDKSWFVQETQGGQRLSFDWL